MPETWLTAIEHHISFTAIMLVCGLIAKEYKIYGRIKERVNSLWLNHCGETRQLYTPLENGTSPVVPPRPNHD